MKQINQYTEIFSAQDGDWLLLQPNAGGIYKKIQKQNLVPNSLTASLSGVPIKTTPALTDYILALDSNGNLYKISVANLLSTPVPVTLSLLHFNGSNNSSTFTDDKGNTITSFNAIISTAQSKFGGASGLFNGSNAYLNIAYNNTFNLFNFNFTIEFWIYPQNSSGQQGLISRRSNSFVAGDWVIWYGPGAQIAMVAQDQSSAGNNFIQTAVGDVPLNQWSHVAIVRNVNNWNIYVNGISRASATQSFVFTSSTLPITIGRDNGGGARFHFNGYLDEFRYSTTAIYTANFTPPTSAFV